MSEGSVTSKLVTFIKQIPTWLWISSSLSLIAFSVFLVFLSQQAPDQFAITTYPQWQHQMSYNEILAYHKALKSGTFEGSELEAKRFLSLPGTSQPVYAANAYNTYTSQSVPRGSAGRALTIDQITNGFASNTTPINQDSLRAAQNSITLERNRQGLIDTAQIAIDIPAGLYVQTASLKSVQDAAELRKTLQERGFSPFIQQAYVLNQRWYRVRLGPFATLEEARVTANTLRAKRYSAQIIDSK